MKESAGDAIGVVLVTCASQEAAQKLAQQVLQEKLAACVNIVPGMESFFWWEGKIDKAQEALMIIKTRRALFGALEAFVRSHHGYDVPEVLLLPVEAASGPYKQWVLDATKATR